MSESSSEVARESGGGIGRALRAVPTWGWALLFALVVCLPRLGGFGFWDPFELKIADHARDMARAGALFDPTVGGKYAQSARLDLFLSIPHIAHHPKVGWVAIQRPGNPSRSRPAERSPFGHRRN